MIYSILESERHCRFRHLGRFRSGAVRLQQDLVQDGYFRKWDSGKSI